MKECGGSDATELFKNCGIKNTENRRLVWEILHQSSLPLTADEILEQCREAKASLNLSTVYRILNLFLEKHLAIKSAADVDEKAMFELRSHEHRHYLQCLNCRELISIEGCPLHEFEERIEKLTDYAITEHSMKLFGYCPKCRGKKHD